MTLAEIITIGDEILFGQTLDTNSHWISGALDEINVKVVRKTTIGDSEDQILDAFKEAEKRADLIIITGGLGPTKDDLTKPLLAKYFGVSLVRDEEALNEIQNLFQRANRPMSENNIAQADLPSNCEKISNRLGTAPGMWFDENSKVFISMPGVPYEMKAMMEELLIPKISKRFGTGIIYHKVIKTIGIPESTLASKISSWETNLPQNIKLAYLPSVGQVKLRLTATGTNLQDMENTVAKQVQMLVPLIESYIYGFDDDEIQKKIGDLLISNSHTISTAESCTGGYLSSLITSVPGSSRYYKGSIVSYSNEVKIEQLNILPKDLENHGAVSEEVVRKMAEEVRVRLKTDVSLAVSGIAGPEGGTEEKPVGTVWIAYADSEKTISKKVNFTKDRDLNIKLSAMSALNLFRLNYSSN